MSALKRSALLAATDSDDIDNVVFWGVVVCYENLGVRFRHDDLPLLTTWQRIREEDEEEAEGQRLDLREAWTMSLFLLLYLVAWKQNISILTTKPMWS